MDTRASRKISYGESKDSLLLAAEKLFAEKGFERTSLKDLAKDSGTNSALVSYHFGSKAGLQRALFEKQAQKASELLMPYLNINKKITKTDISRLIGEIFDYIDNNQATQAYILWAQVERGELEHQVRTQLIEPFAGSLSQILKNALGCKTLTTEVEARRAALAAHFSHYSSLRMALKSGIELCKNSEAILKKYRSFVQNQFLIALLEPIGEKKVNRGAK
jgi:AcrR family transcriptional regulator